MIRWRAIFLGLCVVLAAALPLAAQPNPLGAVDPAAPVVPAPASVTPAATPPPPAANTGPFRLNIGLEGGGQTGEVSVAIQIVLVMTLLSVAPSIVLLMTSFTRIVIDKASVPLKQFMLKQTRTRDIEYFLELGGYGPTAVKELPIRVVIPAFVISELQTAFQMGFLLFLPFLVIDFLVSTVLMALGMMMMPPVTISLPLKLLLFVLVDGWHLVVRSLVQSFST